MPFLSELAHRRVLDAGGDQIGHLRDLAARPHDHIPPVLWAIVATRDGERVVRWSDVAIEPAHVRLRRRLESLAPESLPADCVRLVRDLLDQEIHDRGGAALGRVTDVQLEETAGQLRLLGADLAYRGLLRRIGIEAPIGALARLVGRPLASRIVPWSEVRLRAG